MSWLQQIVDTVIERNPKGEILISSGGSPSGTYHLGHMRELVTCDAILLELRRRGRQARHIYFVDDLDVFRKVPANVPPEWEQYLGMPICDVPSPDGNAGRSYADHFLDGLVDSCKALNIEVEFVRSHPKYRSGWFVPAIELCLGHMPEIRQALEAISNRKLDKNWTPVQILADGRLKNRKFVSIDKDAKTVQYEDAEGDIKIANYAKGEVKLDWRLDWPARWWQLHVHVEPFGREHASAGGSYDTGVQIMKDVYKAEPPVPVPYDSINMVGDTKKMSASKGTAISAMEAVQIMPAEVVRYFILRAPLNKLLFFNPAEGVVKLIDEFAALTAKSDRSELEENILYVSTRGQKPVVSRVPFSHLVASYQAALKDPVKALEIIGRTEYAGVAKQDANIITEELTFIDEWLQRRAPEDVKFDLAETVVLGNFSDAEKLFLAGLADTIAAAPSDADGAWFHSAIYDMKDVSGLQPKEMFSALYKAIINKNSGPRAGWFLSILPRDWLVQRLRLSDATQAQASGAQTVDIVAQKITQAQLTKTVCFTIDPAIIRAFPNTAVGYLVARIPAALPALATDPISEALTILDAKNVTSESLSGQPEIKVWRSAFQTFGVKPSKFLSSAEALAKRSLKGNPPHVNAIVDTYNAISIAHLVPMGAIDLDKVTGDICLRYGRAGETAVLLGMDEPIAIEDSHVIYADNRQVITWLWNHRDAKNTAVTETSAHIVFFADSLSGVQLASTAIRELAEALTKLGIPIETQGVVHNEQQ